MKSLEIAFQKLTMLKETMFPESYQEIRVTRLYLQNISQNLKILPSVIGFHQKYNPQTLICITFPKEN